MTDRILKCCDGPDIRVSSADARPLVNIYDAKTTKEVGTIQAFVGNRNLCIYVVDRREKTGRVRKAYMFEKATFTADAALLAIPNGRDPLKAVLRAMGYDSPRMTASLDSFVVDSGD